MPGTYCTTADVESHISVVDLATLANDTLNATAPDLIVMAGLVSHAGAAIEAALQGTFAIPLVPTPPIINSIAVDIVLWLAYMRKSKSMPMPGPIQKSYDEAIATLTSIAELETSLGPGYSVLTPMADITATQPDPRVDFVNGPNDDGSDLTQF